MRVFCFHCECFHVSGECAYTLAILGWNAIRLPKLQHAFEDMDRAQEEETKAQDCVFLWQCGIMADF